MKIKLYFFTLLLALLVSCGPLTNPDYEFSIYWDSNECIVYLDGKELEGDEFYRVYGEPTILNLEVKAKQEDKHFSFFGFNHQSSNSSKVYTNKFKFEVGDSYKICYVVMEKYSVQPGLVSQNNNEFIFKTTYSSTDFAFGYEDRDSRFYKYDISKDKFSNVTDLIINENYINVFSTQDYTVVKKIIAEGDNILVQFEKKLYVDNVKESATGTFATMNVIDYSKDTIDIYKWSYGNNDLQLIHTFNELNKKFESSLWENNGDIFYFIESRNNKDNITYTVKSFDLTLSEETIVKDISNNLEEAPICLLQNSFSVEEKDYLSLYGYDGALISKIPLNINLDKVFYYDIELNEAYILFDKDIYKLMSNGEILKLTSYSILTSGSGY